MSRRLLAAFAAFGLVLALAPAAALGHTQHGEEEGHLPPSKQNMKLLSKLQLGGASELTDVHAYKKHAYVGTWSGTCGNAGVHIVSLKDPRNPRRVGFASAGPNDYVSEGVHVFHVNTPAFKGDLLVFDFEACNEFARGGSAIYDVTNPRNPKPLSLGVGDRDQLGEVGPTPSEVHSTFGFFDRQARRAFLVQGDSGAEFGCLDIDIIEITDPFEPVFLAETGLCDESWGDAFNQQSVDQGFWSISSYNHDLWVKKIDGEWILLVSYWDTGFVKLNIDDPSAPRFIDDFEYEEVDPVYGRFEPEGDAHQAMWTPNNKYILGSDEDFSPYHFEIEIASQTGTANVQSAEFNWTVPIAENFADGAMNGPTIYGGSGCPDDPSTEEADGDFDNNGVSDGEELPPPSAAGTLEAGEEAILVLLRGVCFFSEKVDQAQQAGYSAVVVANSHAGAFEGLAPDAPACGSQGHEFEITASGICTGHRAIHLIFNDPEDYESENGADLPPLGTVGNDILTTEPLFDGFGYIHLIDAETLEDVDQYQIPEAMTEEFATGHGVLSVHEIEADKRRCARLAYAAWYAGGARVLKWGSNGLSEVGHFIDEQGNDFWGISTIKRGRKKPLLVFSDRDFGLYVLKYTGKAGEGRC